MANIPFFTPIIHTAGPKTCRQSLRELADNYFFFGEKKAYVIAGRINEVLIKEDKNSRDPLLAKALRIVILFTLFLPATVFFLCAKILLRPKHAYRLIDIKEELGRGIEITPAHKAAIEELMPKIERLMNDHRIAWVSRNQFSGLQTFRLEEFPQLIFKIKASMDSENDEDTVEKRFDFLVQGKETCLIHQLDLLSLPHAQQFQINVRGRHYSVIAEEFLHFRDIESAQEELYHSQVNNFNKTARQLAIFIAKTRAEKVNWRSIPILEEAGPEGDCRVGLVGLKPGICDRGILGELDGKERGLVGCLFSKQQIIAAAKEERNRNSDIAQKRFDQIDEHNRLLEFYRDNGILENPRKELQVDVNTLGLNLEEQGIVYEPQRAFNLEWIMAPKRITMRKVAEATIAKINELIRRGPEIDSTKRKRFIHLFSPHEDLLDESSQYRHLGEPGTEGAWLYRIIKALIAKGHLFKLDPKNFSQMRQEGYYIQA